MELIVVVIRVGDPLHEGRTVHDVEGLHVGELGDTDLTGIGDGGLAAAAFFGGDEDDAVRGAGTVQGSGGRVLQDGHGFNVFRVDGVEDTEASVAGTDVAGGRRIDDDTVNDIERLGGSGNGAYATDLDVGSGTWVAVIGGDTDTGDLADEALVQRFIGHARDLVALDLGRGAGEGCAGSGTVGNDDDVVEEFGIRLEFDVDDTAAVHGLCDGDITDGGEFKRAADGDIQFIAAVAIGGSTRQGAPYQNGGSRDSFAGGGVGHRAAHGHVLSKCSSDPHEEGDQEN